MLVCQRKLMASLALAALILFIALQVSSGFLLTTTQCTDHCNSNPMCTQACELWPVLYHIEKSCDTFCDNLQFFKGDNFTMDDFKVRQCVDGCSYASNNFYVVLQESINSLPPPLHVTDFPTEFGLALDTPTHPSGMKAYLQFKVNNSSGTDNHKHRDTFRWTYFRPNVRVDSSRVVLTEGITPYIPYQFRLVVVPSRDHKFMGRGSAPITLEPDSIPLDGENAKYPVQTIKCNAIGRDSIQLQWLPPARTPTFKAVAFYVLTITNLKTGEQNIAVLNENARRHEFRGLTPLTQYTLAIRPSTANVRVEEPGQSLLQQSFAGPSAQVSVTTAE
ncbi:hypothetical protein BV898_13914 [Hypsibius exemplaris]|uniref:Fibronectin type-III domain-containing protein n=1 Tax=Hypsibius exemplaris TaxID=2072580 RepID=A0A1W0W9A6_HYPEX|nr:hypothetical protein BV898_13914 [Hypsibius exemplaris]